ncbi:hypothetical protein ACI1MP_36915 [Kitasatospora griseola]|uniref:hypothetical protein n=1 Tax=Kitasatospora griseola TaxID=2064 RepID=UPI003855DFC8
MLGHKLGYINPTSPVRLPAADETGQPLTLAALFGEHRGKDPPVDVQVDRSLQQPAASATGAVPACAYGVRRNETRMLDLTDFGRNPEGREFGKYGTLTARYELVTRSRGWIVEASPADECAGAPRCGARTKGAGSNTAPLPKQTRMGDLMWALPPQPPDRPSVEWHPVWSDVKDFQPLTFWLLKNQPAWRSRSVVRISLSSALWSEREREVLVRPLKQLNGFPAPLGDDGKARLILPIIDMPKVTSVNFTIEAAGEAAHRLPRGEVSRIQAKYLRDLCPSNLIDDDLEDLLAAIFLFNPATLKETLKHHRYRHTLLKRISDPLDDYYLQEKLRGPRQQVDGNAFLKLRNLSKSIGSCAKEYVRSDRTSSAEHPLLVIPNFMRDYQLDQDRALSTMRKLEDFIRTAHSRKREPEIEQALRYYFGCGTRWEIMASCRVPINEPFVIDIKERREISFGKAGDPTAPPWNRRWLRPTAVTYLTFHDAATNHVHISISDSSVEFKPSATIAVAEREEDRLQTPDAEHKTDEQYARYDSRQKRDGRIWIECRLRQPFLRRWTTRGVVAATLAALSLIVYFGIATYDCDHPMNGGDVVALLIPVTVAASLLLARDTTTLAMRIKRVSQFSLMLSLGALWGLTVVLYFMGHIHIDDSVESLITPMTLYQARHAKTPNQT